jgi:hypothetical protein
MRTQQRGNLFPFGEAERKRFRDLFARLKSKHVVTPRHPVSQAGIFRTRGGGAAVSKDRYSLPHALRR